MSIASTDTPFLQSRASTLIIPVSSRGEVLNKTLLRFMALYPSCRDEYRQLALKGELALGDVHLHRVSKQATGLGIGSNKTASHIALIITHNHPTHCVKPSTLSTACEALRPKLYQLMRYEGLRHAALFAEPLAKLAFDDTDCTKEQHALKLIRLFESTLDTSRVRIDVHY